MEKPKFKLTIEEVLEFNDQCEMAFQEHFKTSTKATCFEVTEYMNSDKPAKFIDVDGFDTKSRN